MVKYEFQLNNGKLKKADLHIWNELLIHAIENSPNKKGEYSIPLAQVLGLGITREELQHVLKKLTNLQLEWKLAAYTHSAKSQARMLQFADVLRTVVKFRFDNSLLSSVIDDPHYFALLESKLSKIAS
jgi:hypothetical protein